MDHRSELDRFRSGAKHDGDAGLGSHRNRVGEEILSGFHPAPMKRSLANSAAVAKLNTDI